MMIWHVISLFIMSEYKADALYLCKLGIKDTIESRLSASYLVPSLYIETGKRLQTKIYDKHDDFHFPIVNFPL